LLFHKFSIFAKKEIIKKTYFISDVHLGLPNVTESLKREKKLVRWLESIREYTEALYLMGDIFDFWYEYRRVVPKGQVRFLAKIAEFTDAGIPVYFYTGNHDIWAYRYFEDEIGMKIIRKPTITKINGKTFYLAHGDGLGPKDKSFKLLKWVFTNKTAQWLFSRLHPDFALFLGNSWSRKKRYSENLDNLEYKGENDEWLILYAKEILKEQKIDVFIFGHRHIPIDIEIKSKDNKAQFINTGDWISNFTYAELENKNIQLKKAE